MTRIRDELTEDAMWFIETAWPPIIGAVSLALIFGMIWLERQQARYLAAIALCALFGTAAWIIDRLVITERERVEQSLYDLAGAYERDDLAAVRDAISTRSPELRELASTALERVTVSNLRVTDVNTAMSNENTRARIHFRVNGTAMLRNGHNLGHQPTRWISLWERDKDRWRLVEIEQLEVVTGDPTRQVRRYLGR